MTTHNVGDVVQLVSGGPEMTVFSVSHAGDLCHVAWFSEGVSHRDAYPHQCLKASVSKVDIDVSYDAATGRYVVSGDVEPVGVTVREFSSGLSVRARKAIIRFGFELDEDAARLMSIPTGSEKRNGKFCIGWDSVHGCGISTAMEISRRVSEILSVIRDNTETKQ